MLCLCPCTVGSHWMLHTLWKTLAKQAVLNMSNVRYILRGNRRDSLMEYINTDSCVHSNSLPFVVPLCAYSVVPCFAAYSLAATLSFFCIMYRTVTMTWQKSLHTVHKRCPSYAVHCESSPLQGMLIQDHTCTKVSTSSHASRAVPVLKLIHCCQSHFSLAFNIIFNMITTKHIMEVTILGLQQ